MVEDEGIWIETMVSSRTGEPKVILRWFDHSGELTPKEAREHALKILAAAEAAEGDAFLVAFLRDRLDADRDHQALMLREFRQYREKGLVIKDEEEEENESDGDR